MAEDTIFAQLDRCRRMLDHIRFAFRDNGVNLDQRCDDGSLPPTMGTLVRGLFDTNRELERQLAEQRQRVKRAVAVAVCSQPVLISIEGTSVPCGNCVGCRVREALAASETFTTYSPRGTFENTLQKESK